MKQHHKDGGNYVTSCRATSKMCFRSFFLTLLAILSLVVYQCIIPLSVVVADDGGTESVSEEGGEDDEEEEDENDDEEGGEDDEEEEDENDDEEGGEDDEEEEDENDDEEGGEDDEEEDENDDEEGGDEDDEEEDENNQGSEEGQEGQDDEKDGMEESQDNDENSDVDKSESDGEIGILIVGENEKSGEEEVCDGECPVIMIENNNDMDSSNDVIAEVNTGENEVSDQGDEEENDDECEIEGVDEERCHGPPHEEETQEGGGKEDVADDSEQECEGEECEEEQESLVEGCVDDSCVEDGDVVSEEQENAAEIDTGNAQAIINILNDVNTNVVGENWMELIYNLEGVYADDINLLEYFLQILANADESSLDAVYEIINNNDADIDNDVEVSANTGDNVASDNEGDAMIETGDATAGVNIVNIANQNLVGNNWLFAIINVFGLWTGDLIVPGEGLLEGGQELGAFVEIVNDNDADIDNDVEVSANTGENIASGNEGEAVIETGDAVTSVNVENVANENIVADNWFLLMINNMGSWTGSVVHWNVAENVYQTVFSYMFESVGSLLGSGECPECGPLSIYNHNDADIDNDVEVSANTGGNESEDNAGDVDITTGDALAWVNIVNFVNNNIVGNNWMFSVVNVMGKWTGDTVFAYPDLEVSIDDNKSAVSLGEEVHYEVTFKNIGEASAEDVEVMVNLPEEVSYQSSSSDKSPSSADGGRVWRVSELAPGESHSFTVTAAVNSDIVENIVMHSAAGVRTSTAEVNLDNNQASDSTDVAIRDGVGGNELEYYYVNDDFDIDPEIELTRVSNISGAVRPGDIVAHQIMIENTGDSMVYDIALKDEIKNAAGETLIEYEWDAGYLLEGEAAIIEYAVVVDGLDPQEYQFSASASGSDVMGDDVESGGASVLMAVAGGGPMYANNSEIVNDDMPKIIPAAHAAHGDMTSGSGEKHLGAGALAILFISILAYVFVANWLFFRDDSRLIKHVMKSRR